MEAKQQEKRIALITGEPTVSELNKLIEDQGLEATAKQLNLEPARLETIARRYGVRVPYDEDYAVAYESNGFIWDVWYGQRSLGETWWLWNVLVGNIGFTVLDFIFLGIGSPFIYYLFSALSIPYTVWIIVGAWRSATNNPGFWAGVVKFLVILQIPIAIFSLIFLFTTDFSDLGGF